MSLCKYAPLLVLAMLVSTQAWTQTACSLTFSGVVIDDTRMPLVGAAVLLKTIQDSVVSVTNEEGRFSFNDICPGTYEVNIRYVGYKKLVLDIRLTRDIEREMLMETSSAQLSEVVIHDQLENVSNALNYSTLTTKQLGETSGKSLGETLREIPGVNSIQAGPGIFKPVVHGVSGQRVLILNGGIRQEGQQWGAEHAPEIDPFVASNIVVVKDASAIKYGTDALGGVIIVNPPELPVRAGLGGMITSVIKTNGRSGVLSGLLEGGIKNAEGWGWRLQGTARRSGDFHTPDYSLTNTGIKELDFSAATGFHNGKLGADVFVSHFQTELGILKGTAIGNTDDLEVAMEREPPQSTSSFSYALGEPRQDVKHDLVKVNGHIDTDFGTLNLQYGFQNDQRKEFDIRKGSLSSIPSIDLELFTHTMEFEWQPPSAVGRDFSLGLTGMFQDNNNVYGTGRIPFIPNYNSLSGGVYGVSKWTFNQWTADLGARYDYRYYSVSGYDYNNALFRDKMDFGNVSITSGASVQMSSQAKFSTSLSSAWRPPHVAELYSLGTHQSAASIEYGLLLNDSTNEVMDFRQVPFKIEQAVKWVNTYQRQWANVQMEVSAYANYIFNYIFLKPTGITQNIRGTFPYFRYTQTDALFLGADLSGIWDVSPAITVTPRATLLRASDQQNDDYLVFIPPNRYEVKIGFEPEKLKNFFIESTVKYTDRQRRAPRVITVGEINDARDQDEDIFGDNPAIFDFLAAPPGYWLWNISTGFSVITSKEVKYDVRLTSENTLNTSYREYTNRFRYYADDMGRNITLSVKCVF